MRKRDKDYLVGGLESLGVLRRGLTSPLWVNTPGKPHGCSSSPVGVNRVYVKGEVDIAKCLMAGVITRGFSPAPAKVARSDTIGIVACWGHRYDQLLRYVDGADLRVKVLPGPSWSRVGVRLCAYSRPKAFPFRISRLLRNILKVFEIPF